MQNNTFFKRADKQDNAPLLNNNIRAREVLCIDQDGKNLGVIPFFEAIKLAREVGLDLMQVGSGDRNRAPTCKIVDYGKLKYEESKQKKAEEKKQREAKIETHEIKFRPTTDENDLHTKAAKTQEFINNGDRVKVSVVFGKKNKREFSHKEIGFETLNQFMSLLTDAEYLNPPITDLENYFKSIVAVIAKKAPQKNA